MDKPQPRMREQTFVVRVTAAETAASRDGWRATIVHVASGDRRYVATFDELCTFIENHRTRNPK
jgi:hypothetical protein